MQWLLNICKEVMEDYLADNPRYVDRGDFANYDFLTGDFTKDDNWHELDLSAIVPTEAKEIAINLIVRNNFVYKKCTLRKKGNTEWPNAAGMNTQTIGARICGDLHVSNSPDSHIEYNFDAGGWTEIFFAVRGWWL